MGKPSRLKICYSIYRRLTQGTETSKYLKEEKTIVISLVAASETELAQTKFSLG